ncbi:unnamed protein product [Chrysoparadoxa australica]
MECSNMGTCNRSTGTCTCRAGFEGAACERMSCPVDTSDDALGTCSGHGRCVTMATAATEWDGRTLVRPALSYTQWDAHKIQGCLCDEGYSGHNCGFRECPRGDDPLTTGQSNEKVYIICAATGGAFTFLFRGQRSAEIPYDAPAALLEHMLEAMSSVSDVTVTFGGAATTVCASSAVTTTVEFTHDFGSLPAAKVETGSSSPLTSGGTVVLGMNTVTTLSCAACAGPCTGGFHLVYDDAVTTQLGAAATAAEVAAAFTALSSVTSPVYSIDNVDVSFDTGAAVCGTGAVTTTITVRSAYGNLPNMEVIPSIITGGSTAVSLTLGHSKGTKENALCSNHGVCNGLTGTCACERNVARHLRPRCSASDWWVWQSSNGYGAAGTRGDCGYRTGTVSCGLRELLKSYLSGSDATAKTCSGNGECQTTGLCICHPKFHGMACSQKQCPTGKAWFDEAFATDKAHLPGSECSNRGSCTHSTGVCTCDTGFTGAACQRLACDSATAETTCSGHGRQPTTCRLCFHQRCLPMWRLAEERTVSGDTAATTYGISTVTNVHTAARYYQPAAAWDFDMVQGCLCDTPDPYDTHKGKKGYYHSMIGEVSGKVTSNDQLSGWEGHMCSLRTCPTGDNPDTTGHVNEVQTFTCPLTSGTFTVTFRQETTAAIAFDAATTAVKSALEALSTISTVTVAFSTGAVACATGGIGISITFNGEPGDVPSVSTSPSYTVTETTKGTKEVAVCSGRGTCDSATGLCTCMKGYESSDGNGAQGSRGDCGWRTDIVTVAAVV